MARKLFETSQKDLFSPLIDVVANGMAAMFIIIIVLLLFIRPPIRPPRFLRDMELPPATCGLPYIYTLPVIGAEWPRKITVTAGALPDWLHLDEDLGILYGTPVCESAPRPSDSASFSARVSSANGSDERNFQLDIYPGMVPYPADVPLTISQPAGRLPDARLGVPYRHVLGASGGIQPFHWSIVKNTLAFDQTPEHEANCNPVGNDRSPAPGLDLKNGIIFGTPSQSGEFTLQVRACHGAGRFTFRERFFPWNAGAANARYTLRVLDALKPTVILPIGRVGETYRGTIGFNGHASGEYIEIQGEVPGLAQADGILSGTPSTAGRFPLQWSVKRFDQTLASGSAEVLVLHPWAPIALAGARFQDDAGEDFRYLIPHTGLEDPVLIQSSQELPEGLSLDQEALTGHSNQPGYRKIRLEAMDALGRSANGEVTLRISPPPEDLRFAVPDTVVLPVGPIHWGVRAVGGEGLYQWAAAGELPKGLRFSPDGVLSGSLSQPATWRVEFLLTDIMSGEQIRKQVEFRANYIDDSKPRLVTSSLPEAMAGDPYEFHFASSGGIGEYQYWLSGNLPEGLSFTERGIQGTPIHAASTEIEVSVQDAKGQQDGPKRLKMTVVPSDDSFPRILTDRIPSATAGEIYRLTLAAAGGIGNYRWELVGSLPAGFSFTEGSLSGTASEEAIGEWPLTVTVTDDASQVSKPAQIIFQVKESWPALDIVTNQISPAIVGKDYATVLDASSCWGNCRWRADGLPNGLNLAGPLVFGVPDTAGVYKTEVTVADERGRVAYRKLDFLVQPEIGP
ncbi:MAG: putative Ig domain-containing protein [Methylococcales bacterium]